MNYWPLSTLRTSPLMPPAFAWELATFYDRIPSRGAFEACLDVARRTAPACQTGLLIIESTDAPLRQIYADYPEFDEWLRLERAGVYQTSDGYLFMSKEPLH